MSHQHEPTGIENAPRRQGYLPGLKAGFSQGIRKGLHGFLWVARILVPVSLAVAVLDWSGWLYALDPVFQPVMGLMNLPPQAALPILTSIFSSFYAALAIIVVIPFSHEQMILLAIFVMICHMLIVEGLIQHKSGISVLKIDLIRLVTAGITVYVVSLFLPGTETPVVMPDALGARAPLSDMLLAWTLSTATLMLKILAIIMAVMVVLETLKALGWNDRIATFFRPFMALFGLSANVAPIWVAGTFFGLIYGSAVIMEEAASGKYSKDELERLHISLGIQHSVVEDPALFLALGISLFWTIVPRFFAAALAVNLYRLTRVIEIRIRRSRNGTQSEAA
ncbi:MAG: nucleoside recognition domain-containing protein [Dehalococcoidia bacterium]|nr:nucleoside recognition domain-containing protein [Dehalococcoidia bacterium]